MMSGDVTPNIHPKSRSAYEFQLLRFLVCASSKRDVVVNISAHFARYQMTNVLDIFDSRTSYFKGLSNMILAVQRHVNRKLDVEFQYQITPLLGIRGKWHAFGRYSFRIIRSVLKKINKIYALCENLLYMISRKFWPISCEENKQGEQNAINLRLWSSTLIGCRNTDTNFGFKQSSRDVTDLTEIFVRDNGRYRDSQSSVVHGIERDHCSGQSLLQEDIDRRM